MVISATIAGIAGGVVYWFYAPYRNTLAFFPTIEADAGFHLTDCGGEPHEPEYFRCNTVNHVFYYEYAFVVNYAWEGEKLNVSLSQDGGALTLKFEVNYSALAICDCNYKINGYIAGLPAGTHVLTVLNCNYHFNPAENATVGTFQVTI